MAWYDVLFFWRRPRESAARTVEVRTPVRVAAAAPAAASPRAGPGALAAGPQADDPRARLSTAFTPSRPVSDLNRFAGREAMIARLIRAIENERMHVVLYGDRGMGKTSMLHALAILAREAGYHVRYMSCSETSSIDNSFRDISRDIPLLYHAELDPSTMPRDASFADLLEDGPLSVNRLCELYGKISGARILLIIDEFDRATAPGFRSAIAEMIKNLSDRSAPVQLVIGGVAGNLNELITFIPSIRRNLTGIAVTAMSPAELQQILERGERLSGIAMPLPERERLAELSVGSPYLLNLLGYESGTVVLDRGGDTLTMADIDAAADRIAADMRSRLDYATQRQLDHLEQALAPADQRRIAREAVGNFGRLDDAAVHMLQQLSPALVTVGSDGATRFCDDALPLILWLDQRP